MKNNAEQFEEVKLAKSLGQGLQALDAIECPLIFSDLELPVNSVEKWKPFLIAASVLFSVTIVFSMLQYNNELTSNYQVKLLKPLIERSQVLENELLQLKEKNTTKYTSFDLIKVFQEIEKIDVQLERIYSSKSRISEKEASLYWKQRIEKLSFALQLLNLDKKPLYI